jgi:hypothetical protein
MVRSIDSSVLLGYYQSRTGTAASSTGSGTSTKVAPTPPWSATKSTTLAAKQASAAVTAALAGHKLIDESAAKLDLATGSADYKKLFALYQGLGTMLDLANQARDKGTSAIEKTQLQKAFTKGLAEISTYVSSAQMDKLRLVQGAANTTDKSKLSVAKAPTSYVTPPLATSLTDSTAAFEGDVQFTISVKRVNQTIDVPIDLSAMSEPTRSLGNVINFINSQLAGAGLETRMATERIPGQPKTITAAGKTTTLPPGPDQFAMKVKIGTSETITFGSTQSANAVYVAQQVGDPDPDHNSKTADSTVAQQLLKFQTDTTALATPLQTPGQTNWVDGRVFANTLDSDVKTVRAQTVGPDGALYMLADVTGAVAGQAVRGSQDVALVKYDSAGKLLYSRTLGAADSATGLSLAVSADGQVAVAGSVSGALSGAQEAALNSGTSGAYAGQSDSFVTLYDKDGEETWTQRRGARQDDQANQVAFGADGTVYVAGQTKSALPGGGAAQGDWDGYVEAFKTDAAGKPQVLFTQSFGGAAAEKPKGMVVDGAALVVASVEDGHAVLRRFDISQGAPQEVASRDLGDLQGGDITGLSMDDQGRLVIAGSTANGALALGTVTRGPSGGTDGFAARLSADLSGGNDRLAYYGGSGDDRVTAMATADGKVWLAGSAGTDLPDLDPVGVKDGFLASLNLEDGSIDFSRRFTGTGQRAAPTAIAVQSGGASILDRLGLPTGELEVDASQQLTAVSALRAGDQFTVQANGASAKTVTIAADETLNTLALKIQRASGFAAKVSVQTSAAGRQLKIEPSSASSLITLGAGKDDRDALSLLGLPEGVIRSTVTSKAGVTSSADGKPAVYGLGLESTLNLSDDTQISHALNLVSAAQNVIRTAYKNLVTAATPKSQLQAQAAAAAASGKAPAYLTAQVANYQAALERLTGGASSDSSTTLTTANLFGI